MQAPERTVGPDVQLRENPAAQVHLLQSGIAREVERRDPGKGALQVLQGRIARQIERDKRIAPATEIFQMRIFRHVERGDLRIVTIQIDQLRIVRHVESGKARPFAMETFQLRIVRYVEPAQRIVARAIQYPQGCIPAQIQALGRKQVHAAIQFLEVLEILDSFQRTDAQIPHIDPFDRSGLLGTYLPIAIPVAQGQQGFLEALVFEDHRIGHHLESALSPYGRSFRQITTNRCRTLLSRDRRPVGLYPDHLRIGTLPHQGIMLGYFFRNGLHRQPYRLVRQRQRPL